MKSTTFQVVTVSLRKNRVITSTNIVSFGAKNASLSGKKPHQKLASPRSGWVPKPERSPLLDLADQGGEA